MRMTIRGKHLVAVEETVPTVRTVNSGWLRRGGWGCMCLSLQLHFQQTRWWGEGLNRSLRRGALPRSAFVTRKEVAAMGIRAVGAWLDVRNVAAVPSMWLVGDLTTPGCPGTATPVDACEGNRGKN